MTQANPPELSQIFGSAFVKLAVLLVVTLAVFLIYRHINKPELEVISANEVVLHRHNDGHYHVNGSINGAPVKFMLDTGASMVSISKEVAQQAGLKCESPAIFTTANGKVEGCVAQREEVVFGGFRVFDVDIAIMPGMDGIALLGMNVLGKFDLQQSDGELRISPRNSIR